MTVEAGDTRPYRRNVGVLLLNRDGLVWVGRRSDTPDAWQMPQGGVDKGEDPRVAALRELKEEIGTGAAQVLAETPGWLRYDLPPEVAARKWRGRYRGQEQKWFACRFTGADGDIVLDGHGKAEFDAWRWVEIERLTDLIVPFKRDVYAQVVAAFRHLAVPAE